MTNHQTTQKWVGGSLQYATDAVNQLLNDLKLRISSSPELESFVLDSPVKEDVFWPLARIAYQRGLFARIPENGLPPVSYRLTDDVDLERNPPGCELPLPHVTLQKRPTKIAGYDVDFPLGLPASVIAANASYLKFYAQRGFDILTYKTVRSRSQQPHVHPQWAFLDSVQAQLSQEVALTGSYQMVGRLGHSFPTDRACTSMANSFGIPSLAPKWWMEDVAAAKSHMIRGSQVLIVSVMATVGEDSAEAIQKDFVLTSKMATEAGADIIELNFSCPNTKERSGDIYHYPADAGEIAKLVKADTKLPVFVKIGFLPEPKLREFVKVVSPSIDGVVAINTVSLPVKDQRGVDLFPGRAKAGVSGWAIQKIAHESARNLVKIRDDLGRRDTLDVLGLGGVLTPDDFWEMLGTGVTAVETCTGAFLDPLLGFKIRQATSVEQFELDSGRDSMEGDRINFGAKDSGAVEAAPTSGGVAAARPVQGAQMSNDAPHVRTVPRRESAVTDPARREEVFSRAAIERVDQIAKDREKALDFLKKSGFVDDDGKLAARYQ